MAGESATQSVINITGDTVKIDDGTEVSFSPNGDVTIRTDENRISTTITPAAVSSEAGMKVSITGDFKTAAVYGANVEWSAASGLAVRTHGKVQISAPANGNAPKAHEVGKHQPDGTVCVAVDLDKNEALFMPEGIFGGKSTFDHQDDVVREANRNKLHGHSDWRRTTDGENQKLSEAWNKVVPPALQGSAAPWFWGAAAYDNGDGRVWRGGEAGSYGDDRNYSRPVPVVFSGPARS